MQLPNAASTALHKGDVLAGKYVIERELGSGSMGAVFCANHVGLEAKVAIKVLLPEHTGDRDVVQRFLREARAASKIRSEHVARVLDVGSLDDGSPFMVMEYLEGTDLKGLKDRGQGVPVKDAVDYVMQACEALAQAHQAGIVHRDLKPANLFLAERRGGATCIKVLDFGISKVTALEGDFALTRTSHILGTPHYMAPEQLRSTRSVDARADIYSLGVILHELLTGEVPFTAESFHELTVKLSTHPAPHVRDVRPELPAALDEAVHRCLRKEPGERFANVAELGFVLARFGSPAAEVSAARIGRVLGHAGPLADTLPADALPAPGANAPVVEPSALPRASSARAHTRFALLAGTAGAVVVLGVGLFVALGGPRALSSSGGARPAAEPEHPVTPSVVEPPLRPPAVSVESAVPAAPSGEPPPAASAPPRATSRPRPPPGGAAPHPPASAPAPTAVPRTASDRHG